MARRWVLALLLLLTAAAAARSEDSAVEVVASARPPTDLVLAGGLDGRVYAIHAWSGDVLWTFDSGGPMVDSSQCALSTHAAASAAQQTVNVETPLRDEKRASQQADSRADGSVVATPAATVAERAIAASAAFMERLVPSYDGRLYHFADDKVTELEMTMADIVSVNGPIRLTGGVAESRSLSDVLLVGEKRSELFALDSASGLIRPFPTSPSSSSSSSARPTSKWSTDILFGRSEYMTQALHARNASFTRCFRISEYFLQFAQQPHCSMGDADSASRAYAPPEIIVIPKDPDATRAHDEGSTIAGFDPWTNEQLWEFEIPNFDVLAVFGLSPSRGSTFYQWRVDGPSSSSSSLATSSRKLQGGDTGSTRAASTATNPSALPAAEEDAEASATIAKQLTRVMPSSWDAVESRFRLRMLKGDNYFLESSVGGSDDVSNLSDDDIVRPRSAFHDDDDDDKLRDSVASTHRWRRRIPWEPIENDGKRGVFITYYHAGAMLLTTLVGSILIAWGCYVKGLSASIAQTAIKSMDQSQFFVSHVHQLTIERPGEEDITISSVISRALLMDTTGSVERPLRMLRNGESDEGMAASRAGSVEVTMDPATEAMMMEKFSRMAATEAAALIASGRYSKTRVSLRQLEYEQDSKSSATELSTTVVDSTTSSSMISTSFGPRLSATLALTYDEDAYDIARDDDCDRMEYEVKMLPAHGELLSSDSESDSSSARVVELLDSEDGSARDEDPDKSLASSWNSENTTGSCISPTSKSSSRRARNDAGGDSLGSLGSTSSNSAAAASVTEDSATVATQQRKTSDASSSLSSSSDDQSKHSDDQVFLPFVCQSRFLHEFEEISAIGKGGFGQVVLAENRLDGRKYAIKRVGLNLKNQTSKTLQKFLREVKILALLDHPNIVRYYQAWLEKVEESAMSSSFPPSAASSMNGDSGTFGGAARNYSMSNLLAPISEMSFSTGNQDHTNGFYEGGTSLLGEDEDDGGFEWERGSSDGNDSNAWKEEDLIVQNKPPVSRRGAPSQSNKSGNANGSGGGDEDDSTTSYSREKCDHLLYIQMQYCAGRNLGDYLAVPGRPMELSKLLKIFVQIASALAHVHSCGLIHRDLKPANIFVADTDGDSIKLGDFGLSRYAANVNLNTSVEDQLPAINRDTASASAAAYAAMGSRSTWSNAASESNDVTAGVGTYLYASPEQVAGKKYNAKTDIYSLGMILFELCHERFATTMERYVTLRNARDGVLPEDFVWKHKCPELVDTMLRLLHRDPLARPTADEVVQWSQALYESSMDMVRSPRLGHGHHHHTPLDHLVLPSLAALASSTFTLQVEAADATAAGSGVPNHNLLKQVCDVIGGVHGGKVEIKKFGLHLEAEGAQILEFVLDAQAALAEDGRTERDVVASVLLAIEELDGVHRVLQTAD